MQVLVYRAHPGLQFSEANVAMNVAAADLDGISVVDLYALYPRYDIDVALEQSRLLEHDVILFQFPLFWYSTPALVKEWQDLVLAHGFAYGNHGDKLAGKWMGAAITAGGPQDAYRQGGHNHYSLRTFLTPLEQTARLCGMRFLSPYTMFSALTAREQPGFESHAAGWRSLLEALRDDRYDIEAADRLGLLDAGNVMEVLK